MTDVEAKEDVTMMPACTSDRVLSSPNKGVKVGSESQGCALPFEKSSRPDDATNSKNGHKGADPEQYRHGRIQNDQEEGVKAASSNPKDVVIAMDEDGEGIETVIPHGGVKISGPDKVKSSQDEDDQQSHHSNLEAECVDDIPMSPLPYDREDPVSLMALPDDIMTLPISPCGPHDEHGTAAS